MALAFIPLAASASVFSAAGARVAQADTNGTGSPAAANSQQVGLSSNVGPGMLSGKVTGGIDPIITDAALTPAMGPVGNASEAAEYEDVGGSISFYTVRTGDTVSSVAEMFGIDANTVLSANGLKKGQPLKTGQTLVILPVKGVQYTIKKGDTLKKIAAAYKADQSDILFYNNLTVDDSLDVGDTIIIPNGVDTAPATQNPSSTGTTKTPTKTPTKPSAGTTAPVNADGFFTTNKNGVNNTPITVHPAKLTSKVDLSASLVMPVDPSIGRLSQGLHQTNAIDIAAPLGTPIYAIADGTVLLARTGGYNDGFGNYVILLSNIDGNQVESIYGHQSKLVVSTGQQVSAGQLIGYVGRTGDATGNHLHLEIRGAKNSFVTKYKRQ